MHAFFLPFGIYQQRHRRRLLAPIAAGAAYQKDNDRRASSSATIGDASPRLRPCLRGSELLRHGSVQDSVGKDAGRPASHLQRVRQLLRNGQPRPWARPWPTTCPQDSVQALRRIRCTQSVWTAGTRWLSSAPASARWSLSRTTKAPSCSMSSPTVSSPSPSTSDQNAYRTRRRSRIGAAMTRSSSSARLSWKQASSPTEFFAKAASDTTDRMTMICRAADDKEISPYVDFDRIGLSGEPHVLNEHVRSMARSRSGDRVTGPRLQALYADLARRSHYAFDKGWQKFST